MKKIAEIKVGDFADNGDRVTAIISQSENLVIYFTDQGKPGFETTSHIVDQNQWAIRKHDELVARISLCTSDRDRRFIFQLLGYSLANAFHNRSDDISSHFETVEEVLKCKNSEETQLFYLIGALGLLGTVSLVVFGIFELINHVEVRQFAFCAFFGAAGASLSVLLRRGKLTATKFYTRTHIAFQGAAQVMYGAMVGVFIVVAIKSEFGFSAFAHFGLDSGNPYQLLSIAAIIGFSERLLPKMFGDFV